MQSMEEQKNLEITKNLSSILRPILYRTYYSMVDTLQQTPMLSKQPKVECCHSLEMISAIVHGISLYILRNRGTLFMQLYIGTMLGQDPNPVKLFWVRICIFGIYWSVWCIPINTVIHLGIPVRKNSHFKQLYIAVGDYIIIIP